jgi:hypothetical protein
METQIDSQKTLDTVRGRYGSVLEFCRQAEVDPPFFYLIVSGQRGRGAAGKRGPNPTKSNVVLQRLEAEGLLVHRNSN